MSADLEIDAMRVGWLTLCGMMLLSRVVFQAAGATRMRTFLDAWQRSSTKRVWGLVALAFAAFLVAGAVDAGGGLGTADWVLLLALLAVLVADGLVNVLPAGFDTFKDRVQKAWVERRPAGGDRDLFLFGNLVLAAASLGTAAVVVGYRPIDGSLLALSVALAALLTPALIGALVVESRSAGGLSSPG